MDSQDDWSDVDAVALRSSVRRRVGHRRGWSGDAEASGVGVERRLAVHRRIVGYGGRSQARPTALLRLRFFCLLHVACCRASLSIPDERRSSASHFAVLRWHLAHCRARRRRGISCPRVCIMTVPPNHVLQRTRHGVGICNPCVPWAGSLSLGR